MIPRPRPGAWGQARLSTEQVLKPLCALSTANQSKGVITVKGVSDFVENGQTITLDIIIDGDFRQERSAQK